MSRTVLQIPVSKSLRATAEAVARDYGFSSLQEIIRVFMAKLASRKVDISIQETTPLSPKAEKRYLEMVREIEKGQGITTTKNLEELFSLLK